MFLYALSNCFAPLITLFVWLAFTPPGQTTVYSHNGLILYFLLTMLVKLVTSTWGAQFLSNRIRRGAISPFLTQPAPYVYHWLSNNIAEKIMKLIYLLPVTIILFILLDASFPSISAVNIVGFVISLALATCISFLLDMSMGLTAFWLEETIALREFENLAFVLFSGALIPIIALPSMLQSISVILPFRYTLSLPIEIFLGQLSDFALMSSLLIQTTWLIGMIFIYKFLWKRGLKLYSASGA